MFYRIYGDISYLLDVKIDKHLFRAMVQSWNSAYGCFTFGKVDLVPTIEEYTALLCCPRVQIDKVYTRAVNVPSFVKRLMKITRMSEQWVSTRIQQKGEGKCIPWVNLRDLVLKHPDVKRKIDLFALSIYGLFIFPKALRHIDEAVMDLFDRLDKQVTHVPAILAEAFRSLNACRGAGEGRFVGCAQLLMNLQEEDIEWRAPWMVPDEILYRCGSFDWVPLPGIWGAIGYAPLLAAR
ncbi:6-phosphofructo-2-kinase/fructose-2,6-bisphosphatase-like protein [Gossypium australe]|uniref:6-phosphofructo-2-kinase/fructose-2, 6-bisphosphatase-like protein n=1 Tax=Gossypium australe TaxID=47621 RepID=A0A5B6W787_9ROSI|nr:6-phosphofructo-2-kinase/fructose-2,6-bisphosphatase-like protein [Gossypium australe]